MSKVKDVMELVPRALLFYTIVEPRAINEKLGEGILFAAAETAETEKLVNQVGRLRHLGTLAYRAQTPGLDYTKEIPPEVGEWVLFQRHAGTRVSFVLDTDQPPVGTNLIELVLLTDTDLGAVLTDKQVRHLVGWTGAR